MKDRDLSSLIKKEMKRQEMTINLIASENYVSPEVLEVVGSPLMNKYSEGYPGRRYYPGNEFYDNIEVLAQKRALEVFGLKPDDWSVNVQSYSGSPANLAIQLALMNWGDVLMGMQLPSGGHLTHGHKASFSGKAYKAVQYGTDAKTGLIDFKKVKALAKKYNPKVIISGFTAYPRKIDFKKFGDIAKSVGAYHVADISHVAGLILAGLHPSPFSNADVVMTTTHKTLRGPRGAVIFVNRKSKIAKRNKIDLPKAIDKAVFPGVQGGPHNNITAAKALSFSEASRPSFKKYQRQIIANAKFLASELIKLGFNLATNGTDNHLMLIDLKSCNMDGAIAERLLEKNDITANRNAIFGDKSPLKPSGLRIGTPAVTSRGMKKLQMKQIASLIYRCLIGREDIKTEVAVLCKRFPLPY
ncbi:MAG: serine hydroxymethyltransferase [bacterium]|nr:serine hydroxymethyltransferase [bacterium]